VRVVQEARRAPGLDPEPRGEPVERRARGGRAGGVAAEQAQRVDAQPRQHLALGERIEPGDRGGIGAVDHPVAERQERRARPRVADQIQRFRCDRAVLGRGEQKLEQPIERIRSIRGHAVGDPPRQLAEPIIRLCRHHGQPALPEGRDRIGHLQLEGARAGGHGDCAGNAYVPWKAGYFGAFSAMCPSFAASRYSGPGLPGGGGGVLGSESAPRSSHHDPAGVADVLLLPGFQISTSESGPWIWITLAWTPWNRRLLCSPPK
jgi:hypothetical protein